MSKTSTQARFAHAISQRDKKEIAALAKAKADLNIVSSFGSTPLMLGVMTADPGIVTLLLELGADAHTQNSSGNTALHIANAIGATGVIEYLEANVSETIKLLKNKQGKTASELKGMVAAPKPKDDGGIHVVIKGEMLSSDIIDIDPAASKRDIEEFAGLFQESEMVNKIFRTSCRVDDISAAAQAVASGADIDNKSPIDGSTALMEAADRGSNVVVQFLVQNGADFSVQDDDGNTCLHRAYKSQHYQTASYLQLNGGSVCDFIENAEGSTPKELLYGPLDLDRRLVAAATIGDTNMCMRYLDEGAQVDTTAACTDIEDDDEDNLKQTPLMLAVRHDHLGCVKTLLEHDATIAVKDVNGNNVLHLAYQNVSADADSMDLIQVLNDWGASKLQDETNNDGLKPTGLSYQGLSDEAKLHVACKLADLETVRAIIDSGQVDINTKTRTGSGLLHHCAWHGLVDVAQVILKVKGIEPNIQNMHGETAIHLALQRGHKRLAKYLQDNGGAMSLHIKNNLGLTPAAAKTSQSKAAEYSSAFVSACSRGDLDLVKRHVNAGIAVNAQNSDGMTALMHASWHGRVKVVEYLLAKAQANPTIANFRGNTALHFAHEQNHADVVEVLQASPAWNKEATLQFKALSLIKNKLKKGRRAPEPEPQKNKKHKKRKSSLAKLPKKKDEFGNRVKARMARLIQQTGVRDPDEAARLPAFAKEYKKRKDKWRALFAASLQFGLESSRADSEIVERDLRRLYTKLKRQHGGSFTSVQALSKLRSSFEIGGIDMQLLESDLHREGFDGHELAFKDFCRIYERFNAIKASKLSPKGKHRSKDHHRHKKLGDLKHASGRDLAPVKTTRQKETPHKATPAGSDMGHKLPAVLQRAEYNATKYNMSIEERLRKGGMMSEKQGQWVKCRDKGQVYYFNRKTKEVQWESPYSYRKLPPDWKMHEEFGCRYYEFTKTGEQWQEARDLNGNIYYFNQVDNKSQWDKPWIGHTVKPNKVKSNKKPTANPMLPDHTSGSF